MKALNFSPNCHPAGWYQETKTKTGITVLYISNNVWERPEKAIWRGVGFYKGIERAV